MEIIKVLWWISLVINIILLHQWNKELKSHANTMTISAVIIKRLNEEIEELREKLKGGELNDEETSN